MFKFERKTSSTALQLVLFGRSRLSFLGSLLRLRLGASSLAQGCRRALRLLQIFQEEEILLAEWQVAGLIQHLGLEEGLHIVVEGPETDRPAQWLQASRP